MQDHRRYAVPSIGTTWCVPRWVDDERSIEEKMTNAKAQTLIVDVYKLKIKNEGVSTYIWYQWEKTRDD